MGSKTFKLFAIRNIKAAILLALLVGHSLAVIAGEPAQEFTQTINREFSTAEDGTTALYNKYGTVKVKTWQNKSVKIDVTIVVNAKTPKEADGTFKRINVNFTNAWGYVKAETVIAEVLYSRTNSWWPFQSCGDDFKVNYEVWIPAANKLDLKNKYGNA